MTGETVPAEMVVPRFLGGGEIGFADGAVGSLVGSYAYGGTHSLEINGTTGRVLVEDTVRRYTFQATGDETARVWEAGYFNDHDREFHRTFDRHVDELLAAFRRGEEPPIQATGRWNWPMRLSNRSRQEGA
jgi:myo-inositol 2-dehydrogenase / D-chiro-inositol 1-dehydrogenase